MTLREVTLSPEVQGHISRMQQQAISPALRGAGWAVIGLLAISDPVRPEARDVVQALRDRGIKHIVMLTGDHTDVARRIAAELGITGVPGRSVSGRQIRELSNVCSGRVSRLLSSETESTTRPCWPMPMSALPSREARRRPGKRRRWCSCMGALEGSLAIDIGRETVALIRQNWNIIAIPNTFAARSGLHRLARTYRGHAAQQRVGDCRDAERPASDHGAAADQGRLSGA